MILELEYCSKTPMQQSLTQASILQNCREQGRELSQQCPCLIQVSKQYTKSLMYVAGLPILGCSKSMLANRISYWLNVTGPSYNVDTACSSSHFAMVEAYNLIRSEYCDAAIVASEFYPPMATVNLTMKKVPVTCVAATVMFLQKAKDARRIYATFIYGKVNCDGFKEEGITFPSLDKQKLLLEEFYKECNVSPRELSYLEAHATGTVAGDPIELQAVDEALCIKRDFPLLMGSVKSNIGHSEPVSGHCQIAKVLIAMETGIIPPTIHLKHPRKNMTAIIEGRVKIVTEPTEWKGGYVGINSFGFGGANSHILLKSNPKIKVNETNNNLPKLVVISGHTEEAVKIMLNDVSIYYYKII
ncbi:Fatty acid synthase [Camponotus floridanus]|uniref:Fatty acid synthase n=1 Tax=Camponotus floridanus TaxID=104421 RepID=E1ZVS0_CAMFO|nr:Fatty acid synthase [Camponotus floridanus]